jgi:anti-sigma B factor antagonist
MQNDFMLDISRQLEETVVSISGEIDIFSAPDFKEQVGSIIESGAAVVVFDCECLEYIDSTGLGVFVSFLKKANQNECVLRLKNLKASVLKLFVITGLDRILNIEKGGV